MMFAKIPKIVDKIYPNRIWRITAPNTVFLTFDDGPHPETTPWLLDYAKKENIPLNFFWLGEQIKKYPHLVASAKKDGHIVANHGYQHLKSGNVSTKVYLDNFEKGKQLAPDNFFRPPYGDLSRRQERLIQPISPIVMWTWLSYDWKENRSEATILKSFKQDLNQHQLLVFHENDKTKNKLHSLIPQVVAIIRSKHLKLGLIGC